MRLFLALVVSGDLPFRGKRNYRANLGTMIFFVGIRTSLGFSNVWGISNGYAAGGWNNGNLLSHTIAAPGMSTTSSGRRRYPISTVIVPSRSRNAAGRVRTVSASSAFSADTPRVPTGRAEGREINAVVTELLAG